MRPRLWLRASLALLGILCLSVNSVARQAVPRRGDARQSAKLGPALAEVETLLSQGRLDEAKKKILEELGRDPKSIEGYNLLGIVYSDEKDFANALDAFLYALKISPNSTSTHNNLGNLYVAQQKLDLAEKEFAAVLRIDPANRDANYNLGLVLLAQGAPAKAILHLQRVRPANLETRFNLTRAYLRAGRTAEGLKTATALSAENKDNVQLHLRFPRRTKTTFSFISRWGCCWPLKNNIARRNSNWKGPTRYSRKRSRFCITWVKRTFALASMRKPNWRWAGR